jgi:hypothetical protein
MLGLFARFQIVTVLDLTPIPSMFGTLFVLPLRFYQCLASSWKIFVDESAHTFRHCCRLALRLWSATKPREAEGTLAVI